MGDKGSIFAFFKIEYRTADYFYISGSDSVGTNKIMITEMCKTVVGIECVSRSGGYKIPFTRDRQLLDLQKSMTGSSILIGSKSEKRTYYVHARNL